MEVKIARQVKDFEVVNQSQKSKAYISKTGLKNRVGRHASPFNLTLNSTYLHKYHLELHLPDSWYVLSIVHYTIIT
jgi:hypothetical protein